MGYDISAKNSNSSYQRYGAFGAGKHVFFYCLPKAQGQDWSVSGDGSDIEFSKQDIEEAVALAKACTESDILGYMRERIGDRLDTDEYYKEQADYIKNPKELEEEKEYALVYFEDLLRCMELEEKESVVVYFG